MQEKDLMGMTLAELRKKNTLLDTDRLTEQEALRTEFLALQAKFHNESEAAESDYELQRGKLIDEYHLNTQAYEDANKKFGMLIGTLMDKRKFCDSSDELEDLRKKIEEAMDKRAELRNQRRTLNENFYATLHDLKVKYNAGRKERYTELETKQREFRQARIGIAKKYAELREEVRKVIAIRKAEERAEAE